jgi:hypothetical protein
MVLERQFNGRVFIKPLSKSGNNFNVTMFFTDEGSLYKGYHTQLGDYVFLRAQTPTGTKFHRLKVTAIQSADAFTIVATLTDESLEIKTLIAYNGAIMRETANMKLPIFPSGLPKVLQAAMESHFSILVDQNTEGSLCKGILTDRNGITGDETLCFTNPDGSQKQITTTEFRAWVLTCQFENEKYQLGVDYNGISHNPRVN